MSDAAKVLEKAAEIVEAGWCQGRAVNRKPSGETHCAIGAIYAAADILGEDVQSDARCMACDLLNGFAKDLGFHWAVFWNDAPGRTAEEVAAALRELAREEAK